MIYCHVLLFVALGVVLFFFGVYVGICSAADETAKPEAEQQQLWRELVAVADRKRRLG